MKLIATVLLFQLISVFSLASGHHHGPGHSCADHLIAPIPASVLIRYRGSGQDSDVEKDNLERARVIYSVAKDLGYLIPDMDITHASAVDLAGIVGPAGHAAPHAIDGKKVLDSAKTAWGVYEVVFAGEKQQQYVRDTNAPWESALVYAHVAGHVDFSSVSPLEVLRGDDPIADSKKLADKMSQWITEIGHKEVTEFFQFLSSAMGLQDFTGGTFEDPSKFELTNENPAYGKRKVRRPFPTRSVLQAWVKNLPADAPQWKREMIDLYEKSNRSFPAIASSKFMNEGWATFSEYFILAHTPWSKTADMVDFGSMNAGVRRPGISNPYWLGTEGWLNLYQHFLKRPEVQKLTPIERDRLFKKYAHQVIQNYPTDMAFLNYALDDEWIRKQNFFLYKEVARRSFFGSEIVTKQAISRNPERLRKYILNNTVNHELHFPVIEAVSENFEKTGRYALKHEVRFGLPLRRETLAKALYALSQIHARPIQIDTILSLFWYPQMIQQLVGPPPSAYEFYYRADTAEKALSDFEEAKKKWFKRLHDVVTNPHLVSVPVRVIVSPHGKVEVELLPHEVLKTLPDQFTEQLQKGVDSYRASLDLTYPDVKEHYENESTELMDYLKQSLLGEGASPTVDAIVSIGNHAPTASRAVLEYIHTVQYRMSRITRLLASGNWPIRFLKGGRGVLIPHALPEVPTFNLDHSILKVRREFLPNSPPDSWVGGPGSTAGEKNPNFPFFLNSLQAQMGPGSMASQVSQGLPLIPDEDLDLSRGDKLPGDTWNEEQQGQGSGDGEGDPEDEEGEEGEEPGDGAGDGSGGGDHEVIPLELYGEILAQMLELPNLRPTKKGKLNRDDTIRMGSERNPAGHVLDERTAEGVLGMAMAIAKKQGKDFRKMTPKERFDLGYRYMTPAEIVVASREPDPDPISEVLIVWATDTSGSMGPEHRKAMRQMIYNERAALKSKYKKYREIFLIYDTEPEIVSEKDFFTKYKGGGTDCSPALKKVLEILALPENDPSKVNRFFRHFSDGDDFGEGNVMLLAQEIAEKTEYLAYNHVDPSGGGVDNYTELSHEYQALSQRFPEKVGFALLDLTFASVVNSLKTFYGPRVKN